MYSFKSPIALITFKKDAALEEILNVISNYNPPKLYIFQDKSESKDDFILTERVNDIIQKFKFNFPVEFIRHETAQKLNKSIITALNYCFENEEKLIILEDDIVPEDSFFDFCNHLLIKYYNSSEVGCINGCNLEATNIGNKYFLSNLSIPYWGWATWKDKWSQFRLDNYYWEHYQEKIIKSASRKNQIFFQNMFEGNSKSLNVWDVQWNISLIANNYKTIIPTVNLIKNKGFTDDALSTNYSDSQFKDMEPQSIDIKHLSRKRNTLNILKRKYEFKIREFVMEVKNNIENNPSKKFEV